MHKTKSALRLLPGRGGRSWCHLDLSPHFAATSTRSITGATGLAQRRQLGSGFQQKNDRLASSGGLLNAHIGLLFSVAVVGRIIPAGKKIVNYWTAPCRTSWQLVLQNALPARNNKKVSSQ
jgi:hypothetical protein